MIRVVESTRRSTAPTLANMLNRGFGEEVVEEVFITTITIIIIVIMIVIIIIMIIVINMQNQNSKFPGHPTHTTVGERRTYECRICGKVSFCC